MPILAGLLLSLFTGFASFLAQWLTKKAAFAVAAIATFGLLTIAFYATLSVILNSLVAAVPSGALPTLLWLAVPDVLPGVIAAMIATDTAVALYTWNVENLRLASYVT